MIRPIAVVFALALASSAEAMPVAPIHQSEGIIMPVAAGCGPGRTRVLGVCVARTPMRQARKWVRWSGGLCPGWQIY